MRESSIEINETSLQLPYPLCMELGDFQLAMYINNNSVNLDILKAL